MRSTGPHRLVLRSNVAVKQRNGDLAAEWVVGEGETYYFTLQHSTSYKEAEPPPQDALQAEQETIRYWSQWISQSTYKGHYKKAVDRSLLTLGALTYADSGGFVAAPTTSLPEKVGGVRNWDYRFCWLRDTTFSLLSLMHCGYTGEARAWLQWLSRSVQGNPKDLKIMYGITGKREHSEWKAGWLTGYKDSKPVHIGNKAADQLQLDTFGEVLDSLYRARCHRLYPSEDESGEALELPLLDASGEGLGGSGRWALGDAKRTVAVYAIEGDGVGCVRPRYTHGREVRHEGPGGTLANHSRANSCAGLQTWLPYGAEQLYPGVWKEAPGCQPAFAALGGFPADCRSADNRHSDGD